MNAAVERAIADSGVEARLILCTLRHYDAATSLATATLVRAVPGLARGRARHRGRRGRLSAGRARGGVPPRRGARPAAHGARRRGRRARTACGRRCGGCGRSGSATAPAASRTRAWSTTWSQTGIHLEVCPSSNVQTDLCDTYADHPIDALYRRGVSLGVNTDGRAITDIDPRARVRAARATRSAGPTTTCAAATGPRSPHRSRRADLRARLDDAARAPIDVATRRLPNPIRGAADDPGRAQASQPRTDDRIEARLSFGGVVPLMLGARGRSPGGGSPG